MRANKVLNHKKGHRYGYKLFYEKLYELGEHISGILAVIQEPEFDKDTYEIDTLYKQVMTLFIEEYVTYSSMHTLTGNRRGSPAMHIFVELSRICFIKEYQSLMEAKFAFLDSGVEPDLSDSLLLMSIDKCKSDFWKRTLLDKSSSKEYIMQYNVGQIVELLIKITQKMDQMPYTEETYLDFNRLTCALFTRNSTFWCEACTDDSLNEPQFRDTVIGDDTLFYPNRDYIMLCTLYFNSIFRRHYYFAMLKQHMGALPVFVHEIDSSIIEEWVSGDVCRGMGEEGFEDTYAKACEACFVFTGDLEWFEYRYPATQPLRGPVLDLIRPNLAKKYFSLPRVSKDPVLSASKGHRDDLQGKISRYFVLLAVDQYFRNNHSANWLGAVKITNADIERNQQKLYKPLHPCLLQVLSGYWVYSKGEIYPCNDIYKTLWIWFYLLLEQYDGKLLRIDIRHLCVKMINMDTSHSEQASEGIMIPRI